MTEGPKLSNLSRRAANLSWQLFIVTVILVMLSHQIPGGLVIIECIAFFTISIGLVCGIVGLVGGGSEPGAKRSFLPALAGTVLNGLLLFIFITNFVAARNAVKQSLQQSTAPMTSRQELVDRLTHLGTWDAKTPKGGLITWVFTPQDFTWVYPDGKKFTMAYEIDYTKTPVWLTLTSLKTGDTMLLGIIEFIGPAKMRVLGSLPDSQTRPTDFGNDRSVLVFEKRTQP